MLRPQQPKLVRLAHKPVVGALVERDRPAAARFAPPERPILRDQIRVALWVDQMRHIVDSAYRTKAVVHVKSAW